MLDINPEDLRTLRIIQEDFETLIVNIKLSQPWDVQQRYEWSAPDYSMFEDLLMACIQHKIVTMH